MRVFVEGVPTVTHSEIVTQYLQEMHRSLLEWKMLGALSQIADAAMICDNPPIKHTRSQSELKLA